VTHGVQFLPSVHHILVVVNGEISECGSYDELLRHNGPFAQFLKTYIGQMDSVSSDEDDVECKLYNNLSSYVLLS